MIIIVMGVSGSGKTTIGNLLAARMSCSFADADDLHSAENKLKMHAGVALTDADRLPWLQSLRHSIERWIEQKRNVVLACSALRKSYREILSVDKTKVRFVYLKGTQELFSSRLDDRSDHFMDKNLLASQFQTLEEPDASENAFAVDASGTPEQIVDEAIPHLVPWRS